MERPSGAAPDDAPWALRRSDGPLGRHLVAARAIGPGGVAASQAPYALALYDADEAVRCGHCLRLGGGDMPLLRCTKSKRARYCGRQHQAAAWAAGFRNEAAALAAVAPRCPPPTLRLAARALWRWAQHVWTCASDLCM
eukprot:350521-Chlamydomonas_euryale.AAC.16